jgi:dienelactone hydrolase
MSDPIRTTDVLVGSRALPASVMAPANAAGLVVFAHGSGSSRHSPRNIHVAHQLNGAGLATLLFDLLTDSEAADRRNVFDITLLADRVQEAVRWARRQTALRDTSIGLFGASTGAAAALVAAAAVPDEVRAVVSRGGRPDLAGDSLREVRAPTLLIVGGADRDVLRLNRTALAELRCPAKLEIVPEATHLFEEPGAMDAVVRSACSWFAHYLVGGERDAN